MIFSLNNINIVNLMPAGHSDLTGIFITFNYATPICSSQNDIFNSVIIKH